MTPAKTLDDLVKRGSKRSGRGCRYPGCGEPSRAVVAMALRRFKEGEHSAGNFDGSSTRQVSLCERHAVETWLPIQAIMEPLQ